MNALEPTAARLGPFLDAAVTRYHRAEFLRSDPVRFVHRYGDPRDRELVGLVAALLAFGNVKAVFASVEKVLAALGERPARQAEAWGRAGGVAAPELQGFRHRWISESDLKTLLVAAGRLLGDAGPLASFVARSYATHETLRGVLDDFVAALVARFSQQSVRGRGLTFLLAPPSQGSACKRLAMYFRWMVRRDEIDPGVWERAMPRNALRLPLDTHTSRLVRYLGLTARQTVNWKMAEEVTAQLALLDPEDPVRFDFALARLGILKECPHRVVPAKCAPCPIRPVCRLGFEVRAQ